MANVVFIIIMLIILSYPYIRCRLTNAASASWEQLKLQTTAGLQGALQNRKQLDLDIRLHSPYLIMPEGGTYSEQSHLVVVDLGELRVFGTTKDPKQLPKVRKMLLECFYPSSPCVYFTTSTHVVL